MKIGKPFWKDWVDEKTTMEEEMLADLHVKIRETKEFYLVMICRTESRIEKLLVVTKSLWSQARKLEESTCSDLLNFSRQI